MAVPVSSLGYLNLGLDEIQRLSHEQGLDLDLTMPEIIGLGRSVYDRYRAQGHELVLDPIGLAILEQIATERERAPALAHGRRLNGHSKDRDQTAPEPGTTLTPDIRGMGNGERSDQRQGRSEARAVHKRRVRNVRIEDRGDEHWKGF